VSQRHRPGGKVEAFVSRKYVALPGRNPGPRKRARSAWAAPAISDRSRIIELTSAAARAKAHAGEFSLHAFGPYMPGFKYAERDLENVLNCHS
jgi:hypothetical protein